MEPYVIARAAWPRAGTPLGLRRAFAGPPSCTALLSTLALRGHVRPCPPRQGTSDRCAASPCNQDDRCEYKPRRSGAPGALRELPQRTRVGHMVQRTRSDEASMRVGNRGRITATTGEFATPGQTTLLDLEAMNIRSRCQNAESRCRNRHAIPANWRGPGARHRAQRPGCGRRSGGL